VTAAREGSNLRANDTGAFERVKERTQAESERVWRKRRQEILLDLANLPDNSCERFRRRFAMLDVSIRKDDAAILLFRDQLQHTWSTGDSSILHLWVNYFGANYQQSWVVNNWADGAHSVSPNYQLLSLSLSIAVSEWRSRMAVCENPTCPERYFLKGRKTQRFCDRRRCAAYGQRQHKLKWWNANKKKVRPKPNNPKRPTKRTGGNDDGNL
jgi:hypothetical protein